MKTDLITLEVFMSKMKYVPHLLSLAIVLVLFFVPAVSAAGTGQLNVTSAQGIELGQSENVSIYLSNTYDPKLGNGQFYVYFDPTVVDLVAVHPDPAKGVYSTIHADYVDIGFFNAGGYSNGDVYFADLEFESLKNDGSSSSLGIVGLYFNDINGDPVANPTIVNGTFTTKDEVAPVVTITTATNVGKSFQIAGSITDVGGMGTANATLSNGTYTSSVYPLALTDVGNGVYTYDVAATWDVFEDGVTITVNAEDLAGNSAAPKLKVINVKDIGFSNPSPEGYITAAPANASVFMSQIDAMTVVMILGDGTTTTNLAVTTVGNYAFGALPVLGDGQYWVNATGKDTISGDDQYLNWTYTLDTSAPTLAVTITDSDGDGYIEANEDLTFTWAVTSPGVSGFKNVSIIDTATAEVLWSNTNQASMDVEEFLTGNRDLSFRAYDNAGNYAAHDFHLYNNYVAWVNTTKIGTISGLDTEFTAMVPMDLTATSMVELFNGRSISAPDIGTVTRQVENVGQVTSDTYVTVDTHANTTYDGTDTYQTLWVYEPADIIDFRITAPDITRANIVMMEANESYLNELIDSGSSSNINYTQLVKSSAYIFIEGGWTKLTVNPDGSYTQDVQKGTPLTTSGTITETLKNRANQVDLSSGYRLSTDSIAFDATTTPDVGDYALAALSFDGDRIGVIAMMPVVILETADQGTISATTVVEDGTFDASVSSNCKYFGVALYRDTEYNATATVDFSNLNYDMVTVDLSVGGAATERLWHNIYITPGAGKYASAKNTNSLTFDVSGLEPGNYKAVLAGMSPNNGTAQAMGIHDITIVPRSLVANFTGTPTSGPTPLTVQFTDLSAGNPTTWDWNFGDGSTSSVQNPSHAYTTGVYNVTLNVTNALGEESSFTRLNYINVSSTSLNISNVVVATGTTAAIVTWDTNIAANSTVDYGTTVAYGANVSSANLVLAHSLTISGLSPATTYHYRITSYDAVGNMAVTADTVFTTRSSGGGGGGGGGGFVAPTTPVQESITTGILQTDSTGTVQDSVMIYAADKLASVYIGEGVQALEANGQPVVDITIEETQNVPSPGASTFVFAGHAVKVGPAGATFSPAIELTFQLTEEEWNALKPGESFTVKWFNDGTGEWEDIPTTVNPFTHTVIGEITHFSTFAVFKQVAEEPTPVVTAQTPSPTVSPGETPVATATATPTEPSPDGGFPWVWVIVVIVLIAVIGGGYYYMQQKND